MEMEYEFTLTLDGMTGEEFMEKVNLTPPWPYGDGEEFLSGSDEEGRPIIECQVRAFDFNTALRSVMVRIKHANPCLRIIGICSEQIELTPEIVSIKLPLSFSYDKD